MLKSELYLNEAPEFLENKPPVFQKSFFMVFGLRARSEVEVFRMTEEFCNLMGKRVKKEKAKEREIGRKEIYLIQKENLFLLGVEKNKHHWPPKSRSGKTTIKIPVEFHEGWHGIFTNLYKKEELFLFLEKIILKEKEVDELTLMQLADKTREEIKRQKRREKKRKKSTKKIVVPITGF